MIFIHFWWLITSATNWFYAIVSGWGADVGLVTGAVLYYRKNNCHVKGCPRLGKHAVAHGRYVVCKIHHPAIPIGEVTMEHVRKAHKE